MTRNAVSPLLQSYTCKLVCVNITAKLLSHIMRSVRSRVSFLWPSVVPAWTETTDWNWWDVNCNAAAPLSQVCGMRKRHSSLWAIAYMKDLWSPMTVLASCVIVSFYISKKKKKKSCGCFVVSNYNLKCGRENLLRGFQDTRENKKLCLIVHSIINYMVWIKVTDMTSNTLKVGSVNLLKTPLAKTRFCLRLNPNELRHVQ